MNLILSFFWVFGVEFVQNVTIVLVMCYLLYYKCKVSNYKSWIWAFIGAFSATATITFTENIKLQATTLTQYPLGGVFELMVFTIFFALSLLVALWYYMLGKSSEKVDVIIGILFAVTTAVYEFAQQVFTNGLISLTIGRSISHSLAFIIAVPATLVLIRRAGNATTVQSVFWKGSLAAGVMTLLITLFDYGPFLK